jgi:hypothetical protein
MRLYCDFASDLIRLYYYSKIGKNRLYKRMYCIVANLKQALVFKVGDLITHNSYTIWVPSHDTRDILSILPMRRLIVGEIDLA